MSRKGMSTCFCVKGEKSIRRSRVGGSGAEGGRQAWGGAGA